MFLPRRFLVRVQADAPLTGYYTKVSRAFGRHCPRYQKKYSNLTRQGEATWESQPTKTMPKLHEILAVEQDRENAAKLVIDEAITTLSKKPERFIGRHVKYVPFDENDGESEEDEKPVDTTVSDKLKHVFEVVSRALDVSATKDATNQLAVADVHVDGQVILVGAPATTLLMIENKLKGWLNLLNAIPTLAPGTNWVADPSKGPGIYKSERPEIKFRTKKIPQHKVLYEATAQHPAQIEKWAEDVRVGKITQTDWSGMISPAEKSNLIARCQVLIEAVKQARQRANCQEVDQVEVAKPLVDFLLGE